jgi:hypothetical protein
MSTKTYHGTCICKAIKFSAEIDFSQTTGKCNCTICYKLRFWGIKVLPENFHLLSSPNDMTNYTFKNDAIQNLFCTTCGVHAFHKLNVPQAGGEFVSVNVACLDDVPIEVLEGVKVRYADGRSDNWWVEAKEKAIL